MSWDFPPEPAGGSGPYGSGPYYEYPPGYGYPFASGPAMPVLPAAPVYYTGWQARAVPPATPLPLREALKQLFRQYWKVLRRPGAATFAEEMGKAEWGIIWAQVLGYATAAAILSVLALLVLLAFFAFLFGPVFIPSDSVGVMFHSPFLLLGGVLFIGTFIGTIGSFFFNQGILYLLAKAFGGQGSFTTQAYVSLLSEVPIGLLSGLVSLIPYVGSLAGSAFGIYGIVLQVFALMPVHRLSGGKATAVVLIPIVAGYLLIIGAYMLILFLFLNPFHTVVPSQ